jgi:hypothetical protein
VPSSLRLRPAALAALLALALGGCHRADPDVVPFSIRLTDAGGAPVPATLPGDLLVALEGPATRVSAGVLQVLDPTAGAVTVSFDAASHPAVAFPAHLDGQVVRVHAQHNPDLTAPGGRPIPYPALRVGLIEAGASRFQLVLVDSPYSDDRELPAVPRPIGREVILGDDPAPGFPDFPFFGIAASHSRFEAAACGLVYHDVLTVEGVAVEAGDTTQSVIGGEGTRPWTTLHVDTWHRTGSCPGRAKTWTQWAAWR